MFLHALVSLDLYMFWGIELENLGFSFGLAYALTYLKVNFLCIFLTTSIFLFVEHPSVALTFGKSSSVLSLSTYTV